MEQYPYEKYLATGKNALIPGYQVHEQVRNWRLNR